MSSTPAPWTHDTEIIPAYVGVLRGQVSGSFFLPADFVGHRVRITVEVIDPTACPRCQGTGVIFRQTMMECPTCGNNPRCDGDHGAPECADPQCWRSQ